MSTALSEYLRNATFTFERGWRHATGRYCSSHRHTGFEVVLHAAGAGETRDSRACTTAFAEGGIIVYLPGIGHDQSMAGAGEDVCVHIGSDSPPPPRLPGTLYLPPSQSGTLRGDVEFLAQAPPTLTPLQQIAYDHRAAALLVELIRTAHGEAGADESPADRYATLAHDYIRVNLRSLKRLEEVSAAVGISHDYLRHCFRRRYGISLKQWHATVRTERAKDLLANSNLPLKVVADLCGFANARYFSSSFLRIAGVTPGTYRRNAISSRSGKGA